MSYLQQRAASTFPLSRLYSLSLSRDKRCVVFRANAGGAQVALLLRADGALQPPAAGEGDGGGAGGGGAGGGGVVLVCIDCGRRHAAGDSERDGLVDAGQWLCPGGVALIV